MTVLGKARVFVPGHITGFFEILDGAKNPLMRGSRGAGLCTTLGAVTEVTAESGTGLRIYINGKPSDPPVTKKAIGYLLSRQMLLRRMPPRQKYRQKYQLACKITVKSKLQLPVSQGFGMSGAGALGAAMGVARALKLRVSYRDIAAAAHRAEIACRTGLGDVAAQSIGGAEMRIRPGVPPYGSVRKIPFRKDIELVLAVLGKKVPTRDILTDRGRRKKISLVGRSCMESFAKQPTLENLFEFSSRFSVCTGLATGEIISAIREIRDSGAGMAAQSMLGNSIFAVGKTSKLVKILENYGRVWKCGVAPSGPV